jgi:hypothetical protein
LFDNCPSVSLTWHSANNEPTRPPLWSDKTRDSSALVQQETIAFVRVLGFVLTLDTITSLSIGVLRSAMLLPPPLGSPRGMRVLPETQDDEAGHRRHDADNQQ